MCAPGSMIHRTTNHVQAWAELGRGIRQRHEVFEIVRGTVSSPFTTPGRGLLIDLLRIIMITGKVCTTKSVEVSIDVDAGRIKESFNDGRRHSVCVFRPI